MPKICPSLPELLVDLWRFYFGEKLPLLYVRANVRIPLLQIAIGSGINRSADEGLHVRG